MIKIDKDLSVIPESLKPPTSDFFRAPYQPGISSKTTHERRKELILKGNYIDEENYNSRYRYYDVREGLDELYHKKCAFCEQRQEVPHVEHFRPKNIYYWLAYSWDNLLYACTSCNTKKGKIFDVGGTRSIMSLDPINPFREIHRSCASLDLSEQPLLVNPETEDLTHELIFNELGEVHSNNSRLQHTIDQCGISREDLCYQRKKILEDFKKDMESEMLEASGDIDQQKIVVAVLVRQFIRKSHSSFESFLAFRRFAISQDLIGRIIKKVV